MQCLVGEAFAWCAKAADFTPGKAGERTTLMFPASSAV